MIKCHLSRILGEKKLKVSQVARATGINRSTITLLYKEDMMRVSLIDVEKLCLYLEIEIGELFTIIPEQ
jgi:putative transcriptional regulator